DRRGEVGGRALYPRVLLLLLLLAVRRRPIAFFGRTVDIFVRRVGPPVAVPELPQRVPAASPDERPGLVGHGTAAAEVRDLDVPSLGD
ncbi:hypothetical protein THAOC_04130, partial [Thalassiosira oceanica]